MNNQEIAEANFKAFKKALNKNLIKTQKGDIHSDLVCHVDSPEGESRLTYALMDSGSRVKAVCVAVPNQPYKEKPCFDIGVATFEKFRKQGHGKSVLQKAIDELKSGLNRNGIEEFYIELKVDKDNEASHKLCQYFSDEIVETKIGRTYLKLIK
jgi:ribosomal protein S18 acetylase RimI-like enzyme